MQLDETLLGLGLAQRVSYDPSTNVMFLNAEGLHIRTRDDVDRVRRVIEERCQAIGHKVKLVVNYDNVFIDNAVADTYAAMVRYLQMHYYTTASRYTHERVPAAEAGRGAQAPAGGGAHLRDERRGARLRRARTAKARTRQGRRGTWPSQGKESQTAKARQSDRRP